ncbi:MAG: hypothetical protein HZB18_14865 [Chloroflexi bacterium]|nr:hypothetical protein [Chloroflexota bacterium]
MSEILGGIDFPTILNIVISIVGIIISILLVNEGRKFISERANKLKKFITETWSNYVNQALVLLVGEWLILVVFRIFKLIDLKLVLLLGLLLIFMFLMVFFLHLSFQKKFTRANQELIKLASVVSRLTEIEKAELKFVREKWTVFLEYLSANISFTAISNILTMAEPFDVNGSNVIVLVPDILEPSIIGLEERLKELEPILEKIYSKPYKLIIHTTSDINLFASNINNNT